MQTSELPEIALEGPAGTGKSFAILYKLHRLAETNKGIRILIVRATRESLTESALVTFERDVLGYDNPLAQGPSRANRHSYRYPKTGSEIVVAGLKQSGKDQRSRVMSTEYDIIYVQEAPEILEDDYQKLTTRLRNNKLSYQQIIADLNPDAPLHWLYRREASGRLKVFKSYHKDNPTLWDATASDWTEQGKAYIAKLSELTGVMRQRLYEGVRAMASGLVYGDVWADGPTDGNVTDAAEYVPDGGPVLWAIDDGYVGEYDPRLQNYTAESHPRVFLFCQQRSDGTLCVFDELYGVKVLADAHIQQAIARPYPAPHYVGLGNDAAELRGRLHNAGIHTLPGPKSVDESVKVLRDWLGADANGKRKILVHPRVRIFRIEMVSFKHEDGEVWKDVFGHGPAALRYLVWTLRHNQ